MTTDPQHPETPEIINQPPVVYDQPLVPQRPDERLESVAVPEARVAIPEADVAIPEEHAVWAEAVSPEPVSPEPVMAEPVMAEPVMAEPMAPATGDSQLVESPAVESPAVEPQHVEPQHVESGTMESAAARIREKMVTVVGDPLGVAESDAEQAVAVPGQTPEAGRGVQIPVVDALDASLEAEIQAVMQAESAASLPVKEPEPAESSTGTTSETPAAAAEAPAIGPGSKIKGTVQQIHGDDVFLNAGLRTDVVVSLKQFPEDKQPIVGAQLDVIIDDEDADGLIRARLPRGRHKPAGNWDSIAVGQLVDCVVAAVNKGGLQVTVSGLRAFMPASQVELGFAGNLESYVGQKLAVQVTEVNPKKRNLVVSRKVLLMAERAEGEGEFWSSVEVGQECSGTVKTIKDYGAFVNIGPVDGFLHIGEISWSRINHPNEVLQEGQTVDVKILKLDAEKKRISLGMKQLAQNPWANAAEKYSTGRTVNGKVTRITDFGAFVELEPGLEGMVHISELAWRRVGSVGEILSTGEYRDFQVQEVDSKRKRVSLSLKALEPRPEPARPERSETEEAAVQESRKPRSQNLRGGTDRNTARGGLFGNPSDFS